ncbi:hypothetical protein [Galbibacter sp. PAP.153]|uniref:hypothetical protein n=1 Tax=Galbibacter sp. PAP.153 TaxID=3104623 RepID=UPI0030095481
MSGKEEQKLHGLTRKMIKEAGLEKPSTGLKLNIMDAVKAESTNVRFKALISNKSKAVVAVLAVIFVVLASYLPNKDVLLDNSVEKFSSYFNNFSNSLPKTFLYGIIAFGSLVILQITILKNYLDRQ